MIYITQFVFVRKGKEDVFDRFESIVLRLVEKYNGRVIYRIRPAPTALIQGDTALPYEIHFLEFATDADLNGYLQDENRKAVLHLKEESIESAIIVKGEKL